MSRFNRNAARYEDPVCGERSLNELERRLLLTPSVQRLRDIRQAGTDFQRSDHSRFEHTLGVAGILKKACTQSGLSENHPITMFLIAVAYCHDLGHGPFSHHMEKAYFKMQPGEISLHELMGAKHIRTMHAKENGRMVEGVGKVLTDYGIDIEEVIKAVQGKMLSPLKGHKHGAELGADHFDSNYRDVFHSQSGSKSFTKGLNAQTLIEQTHLVIRDGKKRGKISEMDIPDLMLSTTRIEIAAVLSSLALAQHQSIFSARSIATEYASMKLFQMLLEQGDLHLADFESTEAAVTAKIRAAAKLNPEIDRYYQLVFEQKIGNSVDFEVTKVEKDPVSQTVDQTNWRIGRTYGYGLAFGSTPIHRMDPARLPKHHRSLAYLAQLNLGEVLRFEGDYRVTLDI